MGVEYGSALRHQDQRSHAAVVASPAPADSYEDPAPGGPPAADALEATVSTLATGFPHRMRTWRPTTCSASPSTTGCGSTRPSKRSGAFTVTWIEIDAEHRDRLRDSTMAIVLEQLGK